MTDDKNTVIDPDVIETLRELGGEDDPGLVVELIDLYLLDAPERIRQIQEALVSDDFGLLERAAHNLKSASANIGALRLSGLCRELEAMGSHCEVRDSAGLVEQSQRAFADVLTALTDLKG